jgi:hypothetical protein
MLHFNENSIFNEIYERLQTTGVVATDKGLLDDNTPDDVIVTTEAREPVKDSTLGILVNQTQYETEAKHRLVTIGDSLTQGFQSGAIFNTDLSFPAIIAYEMGWDDFRFPIYRGFGGLPLNIEVLIRELESKFGKKINWLELGFAVFAVRQHMAEVENWWERGPGSHVPQYTEINHNLAVYGWDVRDVMSRTADYCFKQIKKPKNQLFRQIVENANERTALRVLNYVSDSKSPLASRNSQAPIAQAKSLGEDGEIETLIVFIGANNALASVLHQKVRWSEDGGYKDLQKKNEYTVWRPTHFESELNELTELVKEVKARHVIWATVPHVTIVPLSRGVSKEKIDPGSRYFPYYTYVWIKDSDFDANEDPCLTAQQARAIDSAIDQYNYCLEKVVGDARRDGLDWHLLDVAGMLDRLACRRYIDDPQARPKWWTKYELPPEFRFSGNEPDSKFFTVAKDGKRENGGLFSLDGVHPTTIAYGLLAQEFINIMQRTGVKFYLGDGKTERTEPVRIDFSRLFALDTLIADPPRSISSNLNLIGWIDERIDFVKRFLRH